MQKPRIRQTDLTATLSAVRACPPSVGFSSVLNDAVANLGHGNRPPEQDQGQLGAMQFARILAATLSEFAVVRERAWLILADVWSRVGIARVATRIPA